MLQLTFLSPARLEQLGQQSFPPQIQPIIPTWFHISHCSTVNNPLFPKSKGMQRDSMASAGRPQQRTHAGHHGILYFGSKSRAVRPWIGNERNGIWLGLCLEQLDRYYYVLDDLGEKKTMQTTRHYTCKKAGCNKSIELPRTWYKHHP